MTAVEKSEFQKNFGPETSCLPRAPGILVADDSESVLSLLSFGLRPHGFEVWIANDGFEALDLFIRNRVDIDLVLLDVQMPGRDGPGTLASIRRIDPTVLACFMTGDLNCCIQNDLLKYGAARVFKKPFVASEVAQSLLELLGS